ncbi:MAG: hypothetical protein ACI4RM_07465, partial [Ruminococcus sp.]
MNKNKLSVNLCRIFSIMLFVSMSLSFICILIFGYSSPEVSSVTVKIGIILSFIVMTAIAIWIYYLINDSNTKLRKLTLNPKQTNTIIFVSVGILFVIQLFVGYMLKAEPVTDLEILETYAKDFAVNGNFDLIQENYLKNSVYLIRYPNNIFLYLLLSVLYRVSY